MEAQKRNNGPSQEKRKIEKPKFSEKDIFYSIDPNSIRLVGEIIDFAEDQSLCGKKYKNVLIVKSKKLLGSGSSIHNTPLREENFKVIIWEELFKNKNKSPISTFKKGDLLQLDIKERLCKDVGKTTYELFDYSKE